MPTILPSNATQNITGFYSLFQYVQEASNNVFVPSVLLGIFVILFVIVKGGFTTAGKAFLTSSFITMILSIFLTTLGFLAPKFMYLSIILTAIGGIWVYVEGRTE